VTEKLCQTILLAPLVAAEVSEIGGCISEDGHDTGKI